MSVVSDFYADDHIGLPFGWVDKNHPNGHSGLDIKGHREGTWIPSYVAGTVARKVEHGDPGNVDDLGNYITVYVAGVGWFSFCHLVNLVGTPNVGDRVELGQGVGPLGDTGYSFGPHLHTMFSTTSNNPNTRRGIRNPLPFVLAARTSTAGDDITPITPEPEPPRKVLPMFSLTSDTDGKVYIRGLNGRAWVQGYPKYSIAPLSMLSLLNRAQQEMLTGVRDTFLSIEQEAIGHYVNMVSPADFDPTQATSDLTAEDIAVQVKQHLADEFARVNANIDDQPTTFKVTPA